MTDTHILNDAELTPGTPSAETSDKRPKSELDATARRPADLVPRDVSKRLSEKSDLIGLIYFITHFGLIGIGAWLCWLTFPGWLFIPVLLVHATIIGFLFSPLHECAHGTAFKSRWLNETALWITAIVYIVPPYFFRYFHLGHHRFTQVPGKDPSLVLPEPANFKQYLWYCAGLWFWWRNLSWVARHAVGIVDPNSAAYVPAQKRRLMTLEARILSILYVLVGGIAVWAGFALPLVLCWLLPRFLGEPIQRMIRVAEHVGCAETPDLLENTRTTLTSPVVNALAWQMPYHAEHHLFPSVPFHQLSKLHPLVRSRIVVEARGYVRGQRDIIAMLRSGDRASVAATTSAPLL